MNRRPSWWGVVLTVIFALLQILLIVLMVFFLTGEQEESLVNFYVVFNCDIPTLLTTLRVIGISSLVIFALGIVRLIYLGIRHDKRTNSEQAADADKENSHEQR